MFQFPHRSLPSVVRLRALVTFVAAAIGVAAAIVPQARAADVINVVLDEAKVLQLPPNTATIIIGNPIVADVTMLKKNNQMILTGKGYGQTNMIALDAGGNSIGESIVRVTGSNTGLLVQRGLDRETYNCAPTCQPSIVLGDSTKFLNDAAAQIKARNASAEAGKR